jgi:superfamily II DNA or RNA helicase
MERFKNKKVFYQYPHNGMDKFGKSYITDELFIRRANEYQGLDVDYVKFSNILIIEDNLYDNDLVEYIFSEFIKRNNYGTRQTHIRNACEIYDITENNIVEKFQNILKNHKTYLMSKDEVKAINDSFQHKCMISGTKKHKLDLDNYFPEEEKYENEIILREYQQEVVDNYNGETGILSFATGLGKTITCLFMIKKFFNEIRKDLKCNIAIWATKKIDILKTQEDDFNILAKQFGLNILSGISGSRISNLSQTEINIILVNIDSINKLPKHIQKRSELLIFDECHNITGDIIYNFSKDFKDEGKTIIGLSATPIKLRNKDSVSRINEIFGDNYIGYINYPDAVRRNLLLPITFKMLLGSIKNSHRKGFLENNTKKIIFENSIETIEKMKNRHKKLIFWTKTIDESDYLYHSMKAKFPRSNINISNSETDPESIEIKKFTKQEEGILICVNRFKEGSNDKMLSCGIMYSHVEKQQEHVFLQQIGRLVRMHPNKSPPTFIQLLNDKDEDEMMSYIIQNIISYYENLGLDEEILEMNDDGQGNIHISRNGEKPFMNIDFGDFSNITTINTRDIINRLECRKNITYEKFTEILKRNNIHNIEKYNLFIEENKHLNLPQMIKKKFYGFKWNDVFDDNYYGERECYNRVEELCDEYKEEMEDMEYNEKLTFYNLKDKRIPPIFPWEYYGVKKEEFLWFFN